MDKFVLCVYAVCFVNATKEVFEANSDAPVIPTVPNTHAFEFDAYVNN